MKRLAIVLLVLVVVCGASAAETRGFSIGGGVVALVPVLYPGGAGIGGGLTVGTPGIPLSLGLSVSPVGDGISFTLHADYRLVDRQGAGPIGWYLGVGGTVMMSEVDFFRVYLGARTSFGVEVRPFPKAGLEFYLELAPEWYPLMIERGEVQFTPDALLARPWLGVRWRF